MNKLLCFFLIASYALGTQINSARSGQWSAANTWSGGVVPGNGDTVSIGNGHTVTVSDTRHVGASGATGSDALLLNNTGSLVIADGGTLMVRGDVVYNGGAGNTTPAVTVQGGGTFRFDASAAPNPAATHYTYGSNAEFAYRAFVVTGLLNRRAVVESDPNGGAGHFSLNGFAFGGKLSAVYADFRRIGDGSLSFLETRADLYDVHHSTFTSCGRVFNPALSAGWTFRHRSNVHTGSVGTAVLQITSFVGGNDAGTREISGNVFDIVGTHENSALGGFTIRNNYFGNAFDSAAAAWKLATLNLIRYNDAWGSVGAATHLFGDISNSYLFIDSDWGNPKPVIQSASVNSNLSGLIVGQGGAATGPPGVGDSGELFFNINPPAQRTSAVTGCIILPNMTGYSSMEIGAWGAFANTRGVIEHNTWFGGYRGNPAAFGFPALQMAEGMTPAVGQIASFRSNILWNPQRPGYTSFQKWAKLADVATLWNNASPVEDICAPASCDYNTGYGYTAINQSAALYVNQDKGYVAKFSAPPGAHDVDVDPRFLDYERSLELFDSKYLGNTPTAWQSEGTYSTGEFVSSTDAAVYWGLPVNFRRIDNSCSGNPKPGVAAGWRKCWEWASLYRIREAVAAGLLFDDQAIGAHQVDIIETLIQWIRTGYSPTNPALAGVSHDGVDIGAVPVSYTPPVEVIK